MSEVKNHTVELQKEEVENDVEDREVVDSAKLEELKNKMREKKSKKEDMPARIVEERKRSLNLGVIGTGQAGSRLAEAWNKLGYPVVCFNTAPQDLEQIDVPEDSKYLLEYGIGGAAKDTEIGHDAAEAHRDGIANVISDKLSDSQVFVLCLSLGGGSGAGSHDVLIDVLSQTGVPIVVLTVLPMSNEDAQTKQNALTTLANLSELTQSKVISNLIVVDNAKLETIYSNVSHMNFFTVGNQAIVKTIDSFNHFSAMSSLDKPLDSMEWAKLFTDGEGLCVYGEVSVADYEEQTAIAEAVMENHEDGLLASGFDLKQTRYAGVIVVANEKVWNNIPRVSIDYAVSMIEENCPGADAVFKGTYIDNSIEEDIVKVYSMFSGLGLPDNRVDQLRKDVDSEGAKVKDRVKARNLTLTLDTGKEKTVSKADEIRNKIAKKGSSFNKNFARGGSLDFRKK